MRAFEQILTASAIVILIIAGLALLSNGGQGEAIAGAILLLTAGMLWIGESVARALNRLADAREENLQNRELDTRKE